MSITTQAKPIQLLPLSQKMADSEKGRKWRETCVDYYCGNGTTHTDNLKDFEYLYKLGQGYLDETSYNYITNPFHTNRNKSYSYPARLRNYDIISPIIQMLLGEKTKRKSDPIVYAINSDITTIKEQELRMMIDSTLDQIVINALNEVQQTGVPTKQPKTYEEIMSEVDSIKDDKAITGQHILNYIYEAQEVRRKLRMGFNDMLITAHVYTRKDVIDDEVVYELYSPTNCGYTCSENTVFIEDGESAWVREYMTISDILDEFHGELTKEEVKRIEQEESNQNIDNTTIYAMSDRDTFIRRLKSNGGLDRLYSSQASVMQYEAGQGLHPVDYVNWKSKVKVGLLQGIDVFGNPYEVEVEEGFKPREGETIKWKWVNQVWEGVRIKEDIYVRIRPIPYQRGSFENPSKCKLLINGYTQFGRHYYSKSVVKKLEPYQHRYNAIHWHIEKMMNKNKDKLVVMPKGLIPEDDDMDMFDMMHFADADGFLFLDELDPKQMAQLNGVKVLDLSLKDYLSQLYQALAFIRAEAEEVVGVTRQRKGQTHASDGKGVTEQAIFQSAIISEEIFLEYEEFEEREYKGMLDLAKFAYRNGKRAWFIDSDKRRVLLDFVGEDIQEIEYGVGVTNGRDKQERLQRIRQNAQAFIQNASKPSLVLKMEATDNIDELIDIVEKEEEKMLMQQAEAQAAEQQQQAAELEWEKTKHADEMQLKLYEIDSKMLQSMNTSVALDGDDSNNIEREKLDIQRENNNIKREEIQARIQMNRENNQTALKNKVVGEN